MKINHYQCLCSNEILKLINNFLESDEWISSLSDKYSNFFEQYESVDYSWALISTSLLMSENLYKYRKSYDSISKKTIDLIADKLRESPRVYPVDSISGPCLLDHRNNIADSFNDYISDNYSYYIDEYFSWKDLDEPFEALDIEDEQLLLKMREEIEETFNSIRVDGPYGCNDSIIENDVVDIKKLIIRTRNALAHSNYEIIDDKNIRLYHYDRKLKRLDFNVVLDSSIIVLIVDELNEIASKKYTRFMEAYFGMNEPDKIPKRKLEDNDIIDYILSYELFDEQIARDILSTAKENDEFYDEKLASDNANKISIINSLIYEKIRPSYDSGVLINNYLYCDKRGKIISDELYDKYGFYKYLNSDYYKTIDKDNADENYKQNEFKLLLLTFLSCSLLTGYNLNENRNLSTFDFSTMDIDENIMKQFLSKNALKAVLAVKSIKEKILHAEEEIKNINSRVESKKKILETNNIQNNYYSVILPREIEELQENEKTYTQSCVNCLEEMDDIRRQGDRYNFDKNLSNFILNSLRNSLAHGYVKFPTNIDLDNVYNTIISFEDYNPDNKSQLTFKGTIKIGDLLDILTKEDYITSMFNIENGSNFKSKKSPSKRS